MIRLDNVSKSYGALQALAGVSFEVRGGEILGCLGPNGAGKTTLVKLIAGLLQPSAGWVEVAGLDAARHALDVKRHIGLVPDRPYLYDVLTAREFLAFVGAIYGLQGQNLDDKCREILSTVRLSERADDRIESYSHGMRQRLALASALLHDPKVLIVDEPIVGLDPNGVRQLKDLLRARRDQGTAIFLSTHSLPLAEELCDRMLVLHRGRIVAHGTIDELLTKRQQPMGNLEDLFVELTGG